MRFQIEAPVPNDEKFKELIVYISRRSEADPGFGATKLNKLLFFADFMAYLVYGHAMTGQEYQCLPYGPAPRRMLPIRAEMKLAGDIAIRKAEFYGRQQERSLALREANLEEFTAGEIALVERIISDWWGRNGTSITDVSHRFIGWRCAEIGETIPYTVALVGNREPTREEIEYGQNLEQYAVENLNA